MNKKYTEEEDDFVEIEVGGWTYKIEAGFMPSVSGNVMRYGLVGQKGFFGIFTVKFGLVGLKSIL